MKFCPRCELHKPNAVFSRKKDAQGRCRNCLTRYHGKAGGKRKIGVHIRTFQAEPIYPTKEDERLIALAARERKKFQKRGSPIVSRPYVYIAGDSQRGIPSRGRF